MSYKLNKKKITLYMQGGIGNQLFQFFAAYSYAKKFNRDLIVNIDKYAGDKWSSDAGVEIHNIVSNMKIEKNSIYTLLFNKNKFLTIIAIKLREKFLFKGEVYKDKKLFTYDDEFMKSNVFNGLVGYFQSPIYFEKYTDDIKSMINLSISSKTSKNFLNKIKSFDNTVAIHYRDYADPSSGSKSVQMMMGDTPINYYKDAIFEIEKKIQNPKYFIFSNNIKTARKKFKGIDNIEYFEYKSEIIWEDMALMSRCEHNIICNSTYSWWSAYLNDNKDKIVITPKTWGNLLKGREKDNDLFPDSWILL
jgi:hypothetical protein